MKIHIYKKHSLDLAPNLYQLVTYDLWGNNKDGYEVNDIYKQDLFILISSWNEDLEILKALRSEGILTKTTRYKDYTLNHNEDVIYIEYKSYPCCELRQINIKEL